MRQDVCGEVGRTSREGRRDKEPKWQMEAADSDIKVKAKGPRKQQEIKVWRSAAINSRRHRGDTPPPRSVVAPTPTRDVHTRERDSPGNKRVASCYTEVRDIVDRRVKFKGELNITR